MTIALGVLASDGVIVAADTQETYTGVFKVSERKILAAVYGAPLDGSPILPKASFAVSGAGSATHLDALNQELCNLFSKTEPASVSELEPQLSRVIVNFNARHIAPFAAAPEYDRPSCSLVMGAAIKGAFRLWTTEKSAMRQVNYGAVGAGAAHASLLLGRLMGSRRPKLRTAMMFAAYVMFTVKQSVDGCGKDTQMIVIPKSGKAYVIEVSRMELFEREFQRYADQELGALRYVLGEGARKPSNALREFRSNLARIRSQRVEFSDDAKERSRIPIWWHDEHPIWKRRTRRPASKRR